MILRRGHRRPGHALTDVEIEGIRQLSERGLLQSAIAARLGISAGSVGKVQRLNGFPHLSRSEGRAASLAGRGR